jgi:hypothetical protein
MPRKSLIHTSTEERPFRQLRRSLIHPQPLADVGEPPSLSLSKSSNDRLCFPDLAGLEGRDIRGITHLWKIIQDFNSKSAASVISAPSIGPLFTSSVAGMSRSYSVRDPNFEYMNECTSKQYPPPTDKCRSPEFIPHEYSIPRPCVLPDHVGDSILSSSLQYENHTCCRCSKKDQAEHWAVSHQKLYNSGKRPVPRKIKTKNLSHLVREDLSRPEPLGSNFCEFLDEAGLQLLHDPGEIDEFGINVRGGLNVSYSFLR